MALRVRTTGIAGGVDTRERLSYGGIGQSYHADVKSLGDAELHSDEERIEADQG